MCFFNLVCSEDRDRQIHVAYMCLLCNNEGNVLVKNILNCIYGYIALNIW